MSQSKFSKREQDVLNKLFSSPNILQDQQVVEELRKSFDNEEIIEKLHEYYNKKYNKLRRKAKEFKERLVSRYPNLTATQIIKKSIPYKKRYNLTDHEYDFFVTLVNYSDSMPDEDINEPMTKKYLKKHSKLSDVLGYEIQKPSKLKVPYDEMNIMNEIKKSAEMTKFISQSIKLQSLSYHEFQPISITGTYNDKVDTKTNFISPVIAAMFLPKISLFEERIIYANLAEILIRLNDALPFNDYPSMMFYKDLALDPNNQDITEKPLKELYNRVKLQVAMWSNINSLRSGHYYKNNEGFDLLINKINPGTFDNPDMAFNNDAISILRRILNAFAIRPTLIMRTKLVNSYGDFDLAKIAPFTESGIPLGVNIKAHVPKKTLFKVPVVTVRIPAQIANQVIEPVHINPMSASTRTQYFRDKDGFTAYKQTIYSSNNVIIFTVDRKQPHVNYVMNTEHNGYVFNNIPITFSSFARINTNPVSFDPVMTIGDKTFKLKSIVYYTVQKLTNTETIVTGMGAIIIDPVNGQYLNYAPQNAGKQIDGSYESPITALYEEDYMRFASTQSAIFIYSSDEITH